MQGLKFSQRWLQKVYCLLGNTPCCPLEVNWYFGGTFRSHLQGRKITQARNHIESRQKADWGDMLLGNIGCLSTDYTPLNPRKSNNLCTRIFGCTLYGVADTRMAKDKFRSIKNNNSNVMKEWRENIRYGFQHKVFLNVPFLLHRCKYGGNLYLRYKLNEVNKL